MKLGEIIDSTRLGCEDVAECEEPIARSEFKRDFDRIIFTPAFRRLQGKTQVFPFPENDHTHNRLTHSLEVYSIARSLGTLVAHKLKEESIDDSLNPEMVGDFVGAAALAHDIGNSPFGHSGEESFSEFFKIKGKDLIASFTKEEKADFQKFEGNAVGFHILTNSKPYIKINQGGLGLTYSTLASFVKYPTRSILSDPDSHFVSETKHSFYSTDESSIEKVFKKLQIKKKSEGKWARYPFAFLVEAADDIAYRIIDFEDGYRLGIISFEEIFSHFTSIIEDYNKDDLIRLNNIKNDREKIGYLRAKAINALIHQVCDVFIHNYTQLVEFDYNTSFLKDIKSKEQIASIKKVSFNKLYNHQSVVEIEVAGKEIISGLLEIFLTSSMSESGSYFSDKIIKLISKEFYYKSDKVPYSGYELVLNISEYIFGMTDACALNLYRKLKGIELPRT